MNENAKPQRYAIVGMKHRGTEALVYKIEHGAPLTLVREASNRFDKNAVQVWAKDGDERWKHVGYVPKTQNAVLAKFIDDNGGRWATNDTDHDKHISADAVESLPRFVSARVHRGNSPVPLVEIV